MTSATEAPAMALRHTCGDTRIDGAPLPMAMVFDGAHVCPQKSRTVAVSVTLPAAPAVNVAGMASPLSGIVPFPAADQCRNERRRKRLCQSARNAALYCEFGETI